MSNSVVDQDLPDINKKEGSKEKPKKRGCLIGCLGIIVLFIGFGIFSMYMSTPQLLGDKDKIVEDIYRYHQQYSNWPQSIKELKSKLPDYQFEHHYGYMHNDKMFVVSYQGSGMMGDDYGEFYRSDNREWKNINSNRKEYKELEARLSSLK